MYIRKLRILLPQINYIKMDWHSNGLVGVCFMSHPRQCIHKISSDEYQ